MEYAIRTSEVFIGQRHGRQSARGIDSGYRQGVRGIVYSADEVHEG